MKKKKKKCLHCGKELTPNLFKDSPYEADYFNCYCLEQNSLK